jgi:hypothetical protein
MRIKVQTNTLASAERKIKEERNKRVIEDSGVLPISFLAIFKWKDRLEVRGRIGKDTIELRVESIDEALTFIKDNI